jgi:hypothetical protein
MAPKSISWHLVDRNSEVADAADALFEQIVAWIIKLADQPNLDASPEVLRAALAWVQPPGQGAAPAPLSDDE